MARLLSNAPTICEPLKAMDAVTEKVPEGGIAIFICPKVIS